jgi:hypothetical protein
MVSIAPDAIAAFSVPLTAPGAGAELDPPLLPLLPLLPLVPLVPPPLDPHAARTTAATVVSAAAPARQAGFR